MNAKKYRYVYTFSEPGGSWGIVRGTSYADCVDKLRALAHGQIEEREGGTWAPVGSAEYDAGYMIGTMDAVEPPDSWGSLLRETDLWWQYGPDIRVYGE
jgi:hypothetical protein